MMRAFPFFYHPAVSPKTPSTFGHPAQQHSTAHSVPSHVKNGPALGWGFLHSSKRGCWLALLLLCITALPTFSAFAQKGQPTPPYRHNRTLPPVLDAPLPHAGLPGRGTSTHTPPSNLAQPERAASFAERPFAQRPFAQRPFTADTYNAEAGPNRGAYAPQQGTRTQRGSNPQRVISREEKHAQRMATIEANYQKAEWRLHRLRGVKGVSAGRWREFAQAFMKLRKRLASLPGDDDLAHLQSPALFYAGFSYQQAYQQSSQQADRLRAVVAFRTMAKRDPLHPLADDSLLQVAKLNAAAANFLGAKRALEILLHNQPHGAQASIARTRLARVIKQLKRARAQRAQRQPSTQAAPLRTYSHDEFKKLEASLVAKVSAANKPRPRPKPKPLLHAFRLVPAKHGLKVLLAFKHARKALRMRRHHTKRSLRLLLPNTSKNNRLQTNRLVAGGGLQGIQIARYASKQEKGLRITIALQPNTSITHITQSPLGSDWGLIVTLKREPKGITPNKQQAKRFSPGVLFDPVTNQRITSPKRTRTKRRSKASRQIRRKKTTLSQRKKRSRRPKVQISQPKPPGHYQKAHALIEKTAWTPPPLPPWVVVIDPGHGGKDPGARAHRIEEKQLTLKISFLLRDLIQANAPHVRVVMTRTSDAYVSLAKRAKIAQRYGANLFLSVHLNAHHSKRLHGVETYTSAHKMPKRETAKFDLLATRIHQGLLGVLNRNGRKVRDLGVKKATFRVLAAGDVPTVLVEAGFLTNRREARKLNSPAYLQQIAKGLYNGLRHHLQSLERQALAKKPPQHAHTKNKAFVQVKAAP